MPRQVLTPPAPKVHVVLKEMTRYLKSGDTAILRDIAFDQILFARSATVVRDSPDETILWLQSGNQYAAPDSYINGTFDRGRRWLNKNWNLVTTKWWKSNVLIILLPGKYYSIYYFWEEHSFDFVCYYVNFQLPYNRSLIGFDTLDLDLDIVVKKDLTWHWKDLDDYSKGIESGGILKKWADEIDQSKEEVLRMIESANYPFDGKFLNWNPNPSWRKCQFPANWAEL